MAWECWQAVPLTPPIDVVILDVARTVGTLAVKDPPASVGTLAEKESDESVGALAENDPTEPVVLPEPCSFHSVPATHGASLAAAA